MITKLIFSSKSLCITTNNIYQLTLVSLQLLYLLFFLLLILLLFLRTQLLHFIILCQNNLPFLPMKWGDEMIKTWWKNNDCTSLRSFLFLKKTTETDIIILSRIIFELKTKGNLNKKREQLKMNSLTLTIIQLKTIKTHGKFSKKDT